MSRIFSRTPRSAARTFVAFALLFSCVVTARTQTPTAFTYQGRLSDAGSPANGTYDFEFKLYDASGTQVGAAQTREDVQVTGGVFLVQLDFGVSPFVPGASASTLEIGVRPGASTAIFTTLTPRQPITSSPYSVQTINAEKLGGVDASQYVKTDDPRLGGSGNNSYVQNTTTQQAGVSFNIGGNGLFGGQVGIGTQTPLTGMKLDVNGLARFTPGGTGGAIQFGSPNGETGMTISNQLTRADIRHDTGVLKLLNGPAGGPPSDASGITIDSVGNVVMGSSGVGSAKLSVIGGSNQPGLYAETNNRGVWGKSTGSSFGVYGESGSGIGVQGVSTSNVGTVGASTSHVGVFGSTAASDPAKPGVLGTSTGTGGVGVRGDGTTGVFGNATVANGIGVTGTGTTGVYGNSASSSGIGVTGQADTSNGRGVYGTSTSSTGVGVYGNNPSGYAIYANGNAGQAFDKSGFVKAMLFVDPFLPAGQNIVRCYNGITNSSTGNCGFSVTRTGAGFYAIDFGFPITNRFFSLTLEISIPTGCGIGPAGGGNPNLAGVSIFQNANSVNDEFVDARFYVIVY